MTDRELLQQALEWVEWFASDDHSVRPTSKARETAEAIKARLAQLEPDPQEIIAKWIKANTEHREWYICPKCSHQTPRRKDEWVSLTAADLMELVAFTHMTMENALSVEAKLKEKNT